MWGSTKDGKSLQNSTCKILNLKNLHTKYVQKMLEIVQNWQECPKLHKKEQEQLNKKKPLEKRWKKP